MTDERSVTNIPTMDARCKDRESGQVFGPNLSEELVRINKLQLISMVETYGIQRVKLWIRNIEEMR